jgi:predicted AlkP superfamily pyrophosphatase or phosphodiesterase
MIRTLCTFLLVIGCQFGFAQRNAEKPYVLLISFDGFRSDYVKRFDLPNFKKFIEEGAAADALIPSFPSKTFPNHYTIVTGLYPGHHGLVDNNFYDRGKETTYTMKTKDAVVDAAYYGGVPIWELASSNGIKSASYFWVGSEVSDEKKHPDYYYSYNQSVPFDERIDQVIRWLRLPEKDRPHLITLYFHSPDAESHRFGPLARETKEKVVEMDQLLGKLVQRVDSTKLPVNIILVSDHGMSELTDKEDTYILIDELIQKTSSIKVVNGGTQAHVYTRDRQQIHCVSAGRVSGRMALRSSTLR